MRRISLARIFNFVALSVFAFSILAYVVAKLLNSYSVEFMLFTFILLESICYLIFYCHFFHPFQLFYKKHILLFWKGSTEINEITISESVLNSLHTTLNASTEYVNEISKGNLSSDYKLKLNSDIQNLEALPQTVSALKENLIRLAEEERQRTWTNAGMAEFAELLRSDSDTDSLTDKFLSKLIKYLNANQGALYVLNDEARELEMVSCFAYDRKKYHSKTFSLGEGLAGQAVLEQQTIYLTDVPDNYISISSGLGEARPRCLIIVPLKTQFKVNGVLEIAAFKPFQKYETDFIERLGELVSSSIHNMQVSRKTNVLLNESREKSELMEVQKSELQERMEEMTQVQEQMNDKERELKKVLSDMEEAKKELENKTTEVEQVRKEEKRMLNSRLKAQEQIHDTIVKKLKEKYKQQEEKLKNLEKLLEEKTN